MSGYAPSVGEELAGYRIEALAGRGGMGEVYRARDERLGRNVALKILVPRLAEDDRFRERFLRESRRAAGIDHPNVIPVYEAGEADGRLYIAMRYVEGSDLRRVLRETGALDPARTLALCAPVAGALDAAHARGLVHRDVKPANVLIAVDREADPPEHVYLSDFGLTTLTSEPDESDSTSPSASARPWRVFRARLGAGPSTSRCRTRTELCRHYAAPTAAAGRSARRYSTV